MSLGTAAIAAIPVLAHAQLPPEQVEAQPPVASPPVSRPAAPRTTPRPFTASTAPKWIVAATTAAPAPSPAPYREPKVPPRGWKPQKRWAVSPVIGTDGVGGELSFLATRGLVFRGRANWLGVDHGQTFDRVHYDGRMSFVTGGLFLDLHPLPGLAHPLFLTAGAIKGRRKASILATPQGSVTYNGHTYTAAEIGTVSGDIRLPSIAPVVGIGFDNTYDTEGSFGFKLMAGVAASSRPKVSLTSTGGLLSASSLLQADIAAEEAKIKAAADYLRYYPVLTTGLSFKF
jgi:hypothetical protein